MTPSATVQRRRRTTRRRPPPRRRPDPAGGAGWPDILRSLDEEHQFQQRVLRLLEKQVAELNQRRQPDYEVMHGVMRYMTQYPDRFHHPKEDLLFDKVVQRSPSSRAEVDQLLRDHAVIIARGAELLGVIERCRADPGHADTHALRKSAHTYIGQLRRHMDVETLRFFPRARRVLRPSDWAEVDALMKPILDPVFGGEGATEFQGLRTAESRSSASGNRRRKGASWADATAAAESMLALVAGAAKANAVLNRHHRAALGMNAVFAGELLRTRTARLQLLREACARNCREANAVNRRLREVWSDALVAAWRPYEAPGTLAARLTTVLDRWMRRGRRSSPTIPAR